MERMPASTSHSDEGGVAKRDVAAGCEGSGRNWYFTKDEIDNHSPSRKDGIDRAKESSLRKAYCSFLKDLGMKLQVTPVTSATAMMFCNRFYMRQSHAKNDWQTVATACMFLACKVEDNLRPLRDVVIVAYEMIHKLDSSAAERIRQREIYYKQKELILDAEHLVLVTIAFDICVDHPFRPLVNALKRLKISNNDVAKAAWNLLNEWLRTTICLQYKPHYIAAGSLSVAAKLLNVRLPAEEGRPWWLEFEVAPKQLEEVTQQMLLYFAHCKSQKAAQVPANLMKSAAKVDSRRNLIKQSHGASGLTVDSNPTEETTSAPTRLTPLNKSTCSSAPKSLRIGKEASGYHPIDCGTASSGVVDSVSTLASSQNAHVDEAVSKIDVGRLKEAFERTRSSKRPVGKSISAAGDLDNEQFIEREVEMAVELENAANAKKQKVFHVSTGS